MAPGSANEVVVGAAVPVDAGAGVGLEAADTEGTEGVGDEAGAGAWAAAVIENKNRTVSSERLFFISDIT